MVDGRLTDGVNPTNAGELRAGPVGPTPATAGDNPTATGERMPAGVPAGAPATGAGGGIPLGQVSDRDAAFNVGDVVGGQFRVRRAVGRGRTGLVYEVDDLIAEQRLALKVALPSAVPDEAARDAFIAAAHRARFAGHPRLVDTYDVRHAGGLVFYTMEYVEGTPLRQYLQSQGKLPLGQAIWVFQEICQVLAQLRDASLADAPTGDGSAGRPMAHGAIRPENILILPDRGLKLLDLGAGRLATARLRPYTPPELQNARSNVAPGPEADVYALGILLFEILAGSAPDGTKNDRARLNALPVACRELIRRCVAPVGERVASPNDLIPLAAHCASAPDTPLPPTPLGRAVVPAMPAGPTGLSALKRSPRGDKEARAILGEGRLPWRSRLPAFGWRSMLVLGIVAVVALVAAQTARTAARRSGAGDMQVFAGIEMVWIPPGSFTMGRTLAAEQRGLSYEGPRVWADDELPRHKVTISKGFWMSAREITRDQWLAHVGDIPPDEASWVACERFVEAVNALGQGHFRLPTEAEWEYACRADTKTAYWFGDKESEAKAYADKPNPWGLYGMHADPREWCQDWYSYDYDYGGPTRDPKGPDVTRHDPRGGGGAYRVVRGGRSSERGMYDQKGGYALRLVRDP
ncbi:MAG: SUMF1/EgtB/PvdO family nonheme iron enzyme [Candidatus Hydrogenedentes bacterium]|nr:SUMF1/EgtB/PvdO family nonheme iron enzyme [Candidatus Hydrogenedentota bacterium]